MSKTVKRTGALLNSREEPRGPGPCALQPFGARGAQFLDGLWIAKQLGGVVAGKILRHVTEKEPWPNETEDVATRRSQHLLLGGYSRHWCDHLHNHKPS